MSRFKSITHVLAVIAAAAAGFLASPAGHAVVAQYPVLAPVAAGIAIVASLYHNPTKE